MKNRTLHAIALTQVLVILLLLSLTLVNEIIDLPHYIFHDAPTLLSQRKGEVIIELIIFILVMAVQISLFTRLYRRIRILEGFIPICARCKKIRSAENRWEQMEKYISEHSLSTFSHGICPDCAKELYPGIDLD